MLINKISIKELVRNNIKGFGLLLLAILSFAYSCRYRSFAKLHINISNSDIPIFIGEIVLGVCFILAMPSLLKMFKENKKLLIFVGLFFTFILCKTTYGFIHLGALALRHAALFYYMTFGLTAYCFYDRKFFNNKIIINKVFFNVLFIVMALLSFSWSFINHYFFIAYVALLTVLALHISDSKKGLIIRCAIISIIFFRYPVVETPRGWQVGYVFALSCLVFSLFIISKIKRKVKIMLSVSLCIFILGTFVFGPGKELISKHLMITNLINEFIRIKAEIKFVKPQFKTKKNITLFEPVFVKTEKDEGGHRSLQTIEAQDTTDVFRMEEHFKGKIKSIYQLISDGINVADKISESASDIAFNISDAKKEEIEIYLRKVEVGRKNILDRADEIKWLLKENSDKISKPLSNEAKKVFLLVRDIEQTLNQAKLFAVASLKHLEESRNKSVNQPIVKAEALIVEDSPSVVASVRVQELSDVRAEVEVELSKVSSEPGDLSKKKKNFFEKGKVGVRNYSFNNALWRLLVWEDMLRDLFKNNVILGVNFGKPFVSIQLAKKRWSQSPQVGWVEPHNSYIHILYRAGLFGLFLISLIWLSWIMLLINFIKLRDIKGIFLSSALLFSLVLAFFIVFLELPYLAIPFWSLFGLAYGYLASKKRLQTFKG